MRSGLGVNTEKTKYMVMSLDQHAGQNHVIKIGNKSFENVEQFIYLGTAITNQMTFYEEIKSRLKSGNACSADFFCPPVYYQKYKD
jgi:hypothetical protein